jgi:hypothetical protein
VPADTRQLTIDEAVRAVYIDFEGTAVDPPSFLGAEWWERDDLHFVQYVLEPALWPAAEATRGQSCEVATWEDLSQIRRICSG